MAFDEYQYNAKRFGILTKHDGKPIEEDKNWKPPLATSPKYWRPYAFSGFKNKLYYIPPADFYIKHQNDGISSNTNIVCNIHNDNELDMITYDNMWKIAEYVGFIELRDITNHNKVFAPANALRFVKELASNTDFYRVYNLNTDTLLATISLKDGDYILEIIS